MVGSGVVRSGPFPAAATRRPSMRAHRSTLFLLFGLSGFSGLIYESIWTHYLKLFLGHAAYAQTLVLAIFMGGMAAGSWLCSKWSARWRNLLRGYAFAEGCVGLLALVFHDVFVAAVALSHSAIIPRLGSAATVTAFKWTLSATLILPQSILLGMTFPLMSAGILRLFPERPGRTIAMLYFTNSLGAAVGVLVSGFVLVGWAGLPGTIRIAGLVNLALAAIVLLLARAPAAESHAVADQRAPTPPPPPDPRWFKLFLAVSLLTGASSFIYEIGWIRMLSLVLGSSTHAFELMLSAFILGLAFGGLFIQRRIDAASSPIRTLAHVQVLMGLLAVATLVLYGKTFDAMQWLVRNLPKTDAGYALFNLSSNGIALAIMLPATFCAGMTLPLITYALLRSGFGERSIGAVYGANTVGAILGVGFAVHVGMPQLGVKGLLVLGGAMDVAVGLALFWIEARRGQGRRAAAAWTALSGVSIAATFLVGLDPYRMASGVYRDGEIPSQAHTRILFHEDGKTATVSILESAAGSVSIRTNGKPDAQIMMAPEKQAASDEPAMILLGVLPMALAPEARTAVAIGLGSGLTSETLLSNPRLSEVDTVEIEQKMLDAARHFRPRVERVYTDPRSRVYIDDAKTFFSAHRKKYDLIVSEPSNPWVSGVAGLFSEEFYRTVGRHMAEGALFVQWLQLYEIDVELVASVLKAMDASFSDYVVYAADDVDLVVVATRQGTLGAPSSEVLEQPAISEALRRIGVRSAQDLDIRKVGTKHMLRGLIESFPLRANSDYFPVLDQGAARTRFLRLNARQLVEFAHVPFDFPGMLSGAARARTDVTPSPYLLCSHGAAAAAALRDWFAAGGAETTAEGLEVPAEVWRSAELLGRRTTACGADDERLKSVSAVVAQMLPYLTPDELNVFWKALEAGPCAAAGVGPAAAWEALLRSIGNRDGRQMAALARDLLEGTSPPEEPLRFLVLSGMLGSTMEGDSTGACRLWARYRGALVRGGEPGLQFRLLAGACPPQ
jgi:spermidine synthase